jgi:hypothetical protein
MLKFILGFFGAYLLAGILFSIVIDFYQYQDGLKNNPPEYSSPIHSSGLAFSSMKVYKDTPYDIRWASGDDFMTSSFVNSTGVYVKERWPIISENKFMTAKPPINSDIWNAKPPNNIFYNTIIRISGK